MFLMLLGFNMMHLETSSLFLVHHDAKTKELI